jgi:flagellar biosynthesis protein FliQ
LRKRPIESTVLSLFAAALKVTVLLALPAVCSVALIGVIVGVVQTIVQVQDQNIAFAPKLAAVAILLVIGGPPAFAMLRSLLATSVAAMVRVAAT